MGVHHEPQFPLRRVFGPPGSSYFQSSLPVFKLLQKARSEMHLVARTEVQDDLPTMEDRGGAVAPFIAHFTEVLFPKFFAVEVVAKAHRASRARPPRARRRRRELTRKVGIGIDALVQRWETQRSASKVVCPSVGRSSTWFPLRPESSAQVTKTRPCETMGLLLPGPGSVAFQRTLFVGPQWSGALYS